MLNICDSDGSGQHVSLLECCSR